MRGVKGSSPKCKEPGCKTQSRANGYCNRHYTARYYYDEKNREAAGEYKNLCIIEGCDRAAIVKDMCRMHYRRVKRHGDPFFVMKSCLRPKINDLSSMPASPESLTDYSLNDILKEKYFGNFD